ncbi:hypothetical protein HNP25_003012 [Arcicella rosea]|uniref:YhhN-like protein n=1 Tax=Arcicella rosea TaxID=502909 RepID=A0A841ESH0_9BACT|nr:hypothetical protein [Arcicella rosea]
MNWYLVYLFILALATMVGVFRFKVISTSNKCFLLLVLITLIVEIIAWQLAMKSGTNIIVYHIFTPMQCALVLLGYYKETKIKVFFYLIPFVIVLGTVTSIWIQPIPSFNSYYICFELFLFIFLALTFFKRLLIIETNQKLKNFPFFWISSGMLIFSITSIFDLGTHNFFIDSNTYLDIILRYIRYFSNYIYYSSFIVAFLVKQNTISDQYGK